MKLDLGFGNSIAVREAFINTYNGHPVRFTIADLLKFDYPNHTGDPELIEITRQVIKRQINKEYKHIFLTNGATGGCVIALRAYQQRSVEHCLTRNAPYYVRYPNMIKASGLMHIDETFHQHKNDTVALIDLPSNPLGMMNNVAQFGVPVILDGVYLNNVYMPPAIVQTIPHDVYVGSYSKLLGINGIRLGWIATNDDILADNIKTLVISEYCGLSTASQEILKSVLPDLDWELFETTARGKMDINREEWSKLEKFFDGNKVKDIGMFLYTSMDQKAQDIFEKAGINWTKGSAMGTNDGFARFNLGQSNQVISEAVKAVLKADKIR